MWLCECCDLCDYHCRCFFPWDQYWDYDDCEYCEEEDDNNWWWW